MAAEDLEARVTALEAQYNQLHSQLAANTEMTQAVKTDTSALVEFTNALKGLATFCRAVGRVLKYVGLYIAPTVIGALALWALITGKRPPNP